MQGANPYQANLNGGRLQVYRRQTTFVGLKSHTTCENNCSCTEFCAMRGALKWQGLFSCNRKNIYENRLTFVKFCSIMFLFFEKCLLISIFQPLFLRADKIPLLRNAQCKVFYIFPFGYAKKSCAFIGTSLFLFVEKRLTNVNNWAIMKKK